LFGADFANINFELERLQSLCNVDKLLLDLDTYPAALAATTFVEEGDGQVATQLGPLAQGTIQNFIGVSKFAVEVAWLVHLEYYVAKFGVILYC